MANFPDGKKMGTPGKPTGFSGERTSIEMSEFLRLRGNEGYGDCEDEYGGIEYGRFSRW